VGISRLGTRRPFDLVAEIQRGPTISQHAPMRTQGVHRGRVLSVRFRIPVAVLLSESDTDRVTALAEFLVMTFGPLLLWGGCGAVAGAAIGYLVIGGCSSTVIAAGVGLILGAAIDLSRGPDE
jgi:hypothetical protein